MGAMKHKLLGGFRKLSLTQQVMVLILLMLAFLTVFFTFFLSDSINETVSRQIFDMMAARQAPIVRALDMGKSASYDPELFDYLAADTNTSTGVVTDTHSVLLSHTEEDTQEYLPFLEEQAHALLNNPDKEFTMGTTQIEGKTIYYRMAKTDYKGQDSVVYSFMNDSYPQSIRSMLTDSTVYITVLAFCLILMVFVFWVFSIIHPLNQIRNYISQIKQGKDVDLYINRDDEIGEVAKELRTLTEELAKQEKSKEEMIHNISHDLKTPIATIKSYSESIKDGIFPYGDLESSVDVILDNAERLEHKVHSLLYMNRVEYLVSSDAEGVVTNMKEVVEQVVLNAAVIRPEIEIITEVEEVFFDGLIESWRVCVENIMENAFRYARSYIRIEVKDNELKISNDGPKMPEERIDSLFKPYIKGEGGRFGLGLSIVYKVVQANKYKVQGLNTKDGVCFRIWRDVPKTAQRTYGFKAPNIQNIHLSGHRNNRSKAAALNAKEALGAQKEKNQNKNQKDKTANQSAESDSGKNFSQKDRGSKDRNRRETQARTNNAAKASKSDASKGKDAAAANRKGNETTRSAQPSSRIAAGSKNRSRSRPAPANQADRLPTAKTMQKQPDLQDASLNQPEASAGNTQEKDGQTVSVKDSALQNSPQTKEKEKS